MKGTIDAKPKLARIAEQSRRTTTTTDVQRQDEHTVPASPKEILEARKPRSRTENQSDTNPDDSVAAKWTRVPSSTNGAKKALRRVSIEDSPPKETSKRASKRLSPGAVDRLYTPIGQLDDEFKGQVHKRPSQIKQPDLISRTGLAIKSYDFGFDSGYAAGKNEQRKLHRYMDQEAEGVTPGSVKLWQCLAAVLFGILIGMVFALFTKGL